MKSIDIFIGELKTIKTPLLIKRACIKERALIAKKHPNLCTLKNHFTAYRNAIKKHLSDHTVKQQSVVDISLKILKLEKPEQDEFNRRKKEQINKDLSDRRPFKQPEVYLKVAINCLNSQDPYQVGIGLCALTGRRISEIFSTAEFVKVDDAHVMFSGQLKTRKTTHVAYKIPVLANSELIIERLGFLRQKTPSFKDMVIDEVHDLVSYRINKIYKNHFGCFYRAPHKPKDTRAIYATICYDRNHKNPEISPQICFRDLLGHGETDIQTANSYDDFYIV